MIVYIGILALLFFAGLSTNDRQARQILPLFLAFLLWFMGGRYYVGCDFTGYLNRYLNLPYGMETWLDFTKPEAGFHFIISAVKNFGLGYVWLNIVTSGIFLYCTYIFCRHFRSPLLILALLFPIMIIQLGMSGLRQALAAGFIMLAIVQFVRGARIMTGLTVFLAGAFHTSAFIFFPMALLAGQKITSFKLVLAILLLTPVSAFFLGSRADVYVDRYVDQIYGEMSSGGALIRYFIILIPALLFLQYRDRIKSQSPNLDNLFFFFTIVIFGMLPIALVSTVALHRLNYYVMPASILMLVYVARTVSSKHTLSVERLVPVFLYGGYSVMWFATSKHASSCYIPYRNFSFL